jgi:hypothetical protein
MRIPYDVNRADGEKSTVMRQQTGVDTMIKSTPEGHIAVLIYPDDLHLSTISVPVSGAWP